VTRLHQDCVLDKRRYAARAEAELWMLKTGLPHLHKCSHCKGWHLTRQNPVTRLVNGLTRTQKRRQVRQRARARRQSVDLGNLS
jgi:hypothetical protein